MRERERVRKALRWCWHNALWLLLAEGVFWSPLVVCAAMAFIVSPWWWTACAAIVTFWAGPFTPAVPLQIGLALAIRSTARGIQHIVRRVHNARQRRWL